MALQARYPSNSDAFTPDFRNSIRPQIHSIHVLEEVQMQLQERDYGHNNILLLAGACANHNLPILNNNGTVFSDPHSDLTCNASGARKRNREESSMGNHNQRFRYPSFVSPTMPTGLHLSNRLVESAATSTSGRPSTTLSPLSQDIVSHLCHQNIEIEALIHQQSERLRLGVEEAHKRHCRALASVVEQQVVTRLKEKELELEKASRRNAELEERVRQMGAENQVWFNVAKNNEAIVCSLKTSLQQLLLENASSPGGPVVNPVPAPAPAPAKEGYGDSDGTPFPANDAQSCCFEEAEGVQDRNHDAVEEATAPAPAPAPATAPAPAMINEQLLRGRKTCKSCQAKVVSVLLLPCRHLCLCKDCESRVETCPICNSTKNACLQIFFS